MQLLIIFFRLFSSNLFILSIYFLILQLSGDMWLFILRYTDLGAAIVQNTLTEVLFLLNGHMLFECTAGPAEEGVTECSGHGLPTSQ